MNTTNALLLAYHAVQAAAQDESAAAGKGEEEAEAAGQQQGDQAQVSPPPMSDNSLPHFLSSGLSTMTILCSEFATLRRRRSMPVSLKHMGPAGDGEVYNHCSLHNA